MKFCIQFILSIVLVLTGMNQGIEANAQTDSSMKEYKIGLMLPFYLHNWSKRKSDTATAIYDYYEGVQMALSDLDHLGMNLVLHVYDTEEDSLRVDSLMNTPKLREMNTVIGPIYESTITPMLRFSAITKIPLVSPFKFIEYQGEDSFPLINMGASDSGKAFGEGQEIARNYPGYELFVISDKKGEHFKQRKLFKEGFILGGGKVVTQIGIGELNKLYSATKTKKVIVYAPIDTVGILKQLVSQAARGKIILCLPKELRKVKAFGKSEMIRGNVHFGDNMYYDKYEDRVLAFRKIYRERFRWEASKYQFLGYDHMMFIGQALMTFGQDYCKKLGNAQINGVMQNYSLLQARNGSYENTGCQILKYNSEGKREAVK